LVCEENGVAGSRRPSGRGHREARLVGGRDHDVFGHGAGQLVAQLLDRRRGRGGIARLDRFHLG